MNDSPKKTAPTFRGEPDITTLRELMRFIDRTPAVTWTGKGGVKERIEALVLENTKETDQ